MKKGGGGAPKGALMDAIKRDFGSFDEFKSQFKTAGMTQVRRRGAGSMAGRGAAHGGARMPAAQPLGRSPPRTRPHPHPHPHAQFGSGWAWLNTDKAGKLSISKTPNAVVPVVEGKTPILTVDVWEHAYYLDFQNRRPDFIQTFMDHLINWDAVEARYSKR